METKQLKNINGDNISPKVYNDFIYDDVWEFGSPIISSIKKIVNESSDNNDVYESDVFMIDKNTKILLYNTLEKSYYNISDESVDITFDSVKPGNTFELSNMYKNKIGDLYWREEKSKIKLKFTYNSSTGVCSNVTLTTIVPIYHSVCIHDPYNRFEGRTLNIYSWVKPDGYSEEIRLCGNWPGTELNCDYNTGIWKGVIDLGKLSEYDYKSIYDKKYFDKIGYIINGGDGGKQTVNIYVGTYDEGNSGSSMNKPFDGSIITIGNDVSTYSLQPTVYNMNTVPLCDFEDLPDNVKEMIKKDIENKK